MSKTFDFYYSLVSPWTYLGFARMLDIAKRHDAAINYKPVELAKVFAETGGLPLPKRAPARQAYRLQELKRWREIVDDEAQVALAREVETGQLEITKDWHNFL